VSLIYGWGGVVKQSVKPLINLSPEFHTTHSDSTPTVNISG